MYICPSAFDANTPTVIKIDGEEAFYDLMLDASGDPQFTEIYVLDCMFVGV